MDPTSTEMPRDRSTFLTLPLELRLEIYTHLLVLPLPPPPETQQPIYRCAHPYSPTWEQQKAIIHTQILRVNQQINREATPLLYTHNTFTAHPAMLTLAPILHDDDAYWQINPRRSCSNSRWTKLIRKWHFRVYVGSAALAVTWDRSQVSAAFSHVQELTLELRSGQYPHFVKIDDNGPGVSYVFGEESRPAGVLRLFEGVRGVRRVRVTGTVGELEGYVKWLTGRMTSMDQEEGQVDNQRLRLPYLPQYMAEV